MLDVIPVDLVAIGMVLSCAELLENTHKTVYQYGTSASNPLPMYRLVELVSLLFLNVFVKEESTATVQQRIEATHMASIRIGTMVSKPNK